MFVIVTECLDLVDYNYTAELYAAVRRTSMCSYTCHVFLIMLLCVLLYDTAVVAAYVVVVVVVVVVLAVAVHDISLAAVRAGPSKHMGRLMGRAERPI